MNQMKKQLMLIRSQICPICPRIERKVDDKVWSLSWRKITDETLYQIIHEIRRKLKIKVI